MDQTIYQNNQVPNQDQYQPQNQGYTPPPQYNPSTPPPQPNPQPSPPKKSRGRGLIVFLLVLSLLTNAILGYLVWRMWSSENPLNLNLPSVMDSDSRDDGPLTFDPEASPSSTTFPENSSDQLPQPTSSSIPTLTDAGTPPQKLPMSTQAFNFNTATIYGSMKYPEKLKKVGQSQVSCLSEDAQSAQISRQKGDVLMIEKDNTGYSVPIALIDLIESTDNISNPVLGNYCTTGETQMAHVKGTSRNELLITSADKSYSAPLSELISNSSNATCSLLAAANDGTYFECLNTSDSGIKRVHRLDPDFQTVELLAECTYTYTDREYGAGSFKCTYYLEG